jgi:hypothetical protein
MTNEEEKLLILFMGCDHAKDNKGHNPSTDWGWMMDVLQELRKRDVAWVIGSKEVRIYDHLEYDVRWDVNNIDPLPETFKAVMNYIRYATKL